MKGITRALLASLVLVFLSACATTEMVPQHPSLRVMTFNIRLDLASDGADAWPHRKNAVASMIRFHGADLVGLQEALPAQLGDLETLLPDFGRFGAGRDEDLGGEHCAILYRRDRFELLDNGTFWLSETPLIPGSKGWDAAYVRIVTWGRLRDLRSNEIFFHFNTHFDNVSEKARHESAKLLVSRLREITGQSASVVLTGDLNTTSDSLPVQTIVAAGLLDAIGITVDPHHGPTSTWNGFRQIEPNRRIDFVFVGGSIEVLRHGILSDLFDHGFPSDHFPVLAEIRIGN